MATAARQVLLALAHLRCGDTYARLAAGFGIGVATVYRYIREVIDVLAAATSTLTEAMKTVRAEVLVILDGTLLPIDRIAADTPYYSGEHKRHGMSVQVLTDPFGRLRWASPALPGSTHDLTATRRRGIIDALTEADVKCGRTRLTRAPGGPSGHPPRGAVQGPSAQTLYLHFRGFRVGIFQPYIRARAMHLASRRLYPVASPISSIASCHLP